MCVPVCVSDIKRHTAQPVPSIGWLLVKSYPIEKPSLIIIVFPIVAFPKRMGLFPACTQLCGVTSQ